MSGLKIDLDRLLNRRSAALYVYEFGKFLREGYIRRLNCRMAMPIGV